MTEAPLYFPLKSSWNSDVAQSFFLKNGVSWVVGRAVCFQSIVLQQEPWQHGMESPGGSQDYPGFPKFSFLTEYVVKKPIPVYKYALNASLWYLRPDLSNGYRSDSSTVILESSLRISS